MINRAKMNINTKFNMNLSANSIEEFKKILEQRKKDIPKISSEIVDKVSEEGLKDNFKSVTKKSIAMEGNAAKGGIESNDEIDTYREFGTGIVGSQNPHISEVLERAGWKYDVNEYGEKGWFYPKGDGTFGWTKGQVAQRKFYNSILRMRDRLPEIAKEVFKNYSKGG